jgi:hypothetical protein
MQALQALAVLQGSDDAVGSRKPETQELIT